jgi:hypothetical protein
MMVGAEVDPEGVKRLNRKLERLRDRLDAGNPGSTVRQVLRRVTLLIQARMMVYPPQRAGSSYRRTGTLGRTWTSDVYSEGDSLIGKVGNVTKYAPQVQSERFQRPMHKGRWQTDAQVIREAQPEIVREFEALSRDVVREFNG